MITLDNIKIFNKTQFKNNILNSNGEIVNLLKNSPIYIKDGYKETIIGIINNPSNEGDDFYGNILIYNSQIEFKMIKIEFSEFGYTTKKDGILINHISTCVELG